MQYNFGYLKSYHSKTYLVVLSSRVVSVVVLKQKKTGSFYFNTGITNSHVAKLN